MKFIIVKHEEDYEVEQVDDSDIRKGYNSEIEGLKAVRAIKGCRKESNEYVVIDSNYKQRKAAEAQIRRENNECAKPRPY